MPQRTSLLLAILPWPSSPSSWTAKAEGLTNLRPSTAATVNARQSRLPLSRTSPQQLACNETNSTALDRIYSGPSRSKASGALTGGVQWEPRFAS